MILSMTGYGKSVVAFGNKKINVEIRSLNSKALDLSMRIAPLYREKEMEVRQLVATSLKRGKVDFSIWVEQAEGCNATPVNAMLMETYYQQLKQLVERAGIPEPTDWLGTLLRMPDVMTRTEEEHLDEEEWKMVKKAIDEAIAAVVDFRKQEGRALEKKFHEKVDAIEQLLKDIEPLEQSRVAKIRENIVKQLETIPEANYDNNRLEQELIYYIEKLDISEEKQRLANHLKYFRQTMSEELPNGKKLGFIAQEMGREINTTGSKSNQAEMQNIVVKMKDQLEQIKEQVLNAL